MKIAIANDHHGVEAKQKLMTYIESLGHQVLNFGSDTKESVDYPLYAIKVGESVSKHEADFGILLCGTGIGMCITCNKVHGIRCAKVSTKEECKLIRQHNNANVLALSGKQDIEELKGLVQTFLTTPFSEEERHARRVKEIEEYENA